MANVEVIMLGEFDPERNSRIFDAVAHERFYWQGLLKFEDYRNWGPRIYVYSDRLDPLGDDYGVKPGTLEVVKDAGLARLAIAQAVEQCFDHTITLEVLSDGKGGWIPLQTDT